MSWGLASFLILGFGLAVGFGWYERTRPSARLLAVVGTLAALAIVGRIAFAPIPNVKPTTDIVFIAGYALGGAPGFVVGAVAAVVSNFFFGQGPWTPWQMAAWGLVGLIGAGLGRASGRRLPRVALAVACALCGLLFGAIMDGSTWVTGSAAHSWREYVAISGLSLPFNVAHAAGNLLFFLAFGPALVRSVERCRARFDVAWQPVLPVVLAVIVAAAALSPAGARAAASPVARGVAYLVKSRNADGGWGGAPGESSNGLHTAWAAYALAAAGRQPDASAVLIRRLGASTTIGDLERTVLGLRACGADPRAAAGRDLVAELLAAQARNGSFGGYVSYTSYAILALKAAGESRGIGGALHWLTREANRDGGFNVFQRGGPSNADDTAGAVEALVAAGRRRTATVHHAVAFLRGAQHADGGYALAQGSPTNAQSTAFAALGLQAGGANPAKVRRHGRSPLGYLRALQARNGSFAYARGSHQTPVWVTAQAVLALERRPLPVLPAAARGHSRARPADPFAEVLAAVRALIAAVLTAVTIH